MGLRLVKKLEDSAQSLEQMIVEMGILSVNDLNEARMRATNKNVTVEKILIDEGFVTELDMARIYSTQSRTEVVDLAREKPTPEALAKVTAKVAAKHKVIPLAIEAGTLYLILASPDDIPALEKLAPVLELRLDFRYAPASQVLQALSKYYSIETTAPAAAVESATPTAGPSAEKPEENTKTRSVLKIKFVDGVMTVEAVINQIIESAVASRVSDIHLEPDEAIVRIRCRVDGILHEVTTLKGEMHAQLISRLKVMAGLDIAEKRNAQDGSFQHQLATRTIDLRLSTLPTVRGEKAVLRILDKSALKVRLEDLGMTAQMLQVARRALETPHGLILVTGPTGSGKTTTVYSMLNHLNSIERNIITVEDPVEFQFGIINQVQVNARAGLTFVGVLRNILRQDPDTIMVGEIRDKETAELAIRAALTGHLVISTIHTNDSLSTVTRLVDMGIEPFMVSSAITAVVSQRLVRTLCPTCRKPRTLNPGEINAICPAFGNLTDGTVFEAGSCDACFGYGYKGRQAIFELLTPTPQLRKAIAANKSPDELVQIQESMGFQSMRADGVGRVLKGQTSLDEVLKATV